MTKTFTLICALGALFMGAAEAKQTKLMRKEGILGAMGRLECGPSWFAPTVQLSGLRDANFNRLPRGTRIIAPDGCAGKRAPREVRAESHKVLSRDAAETIREAVAAPVSAQNRVTSTVSKSPESKIALKKAEAAPAEKKENKQAEAKKAPEDQAKTVVVVKSGSMGEKIGYAGIGALIAAVIAAYLWLSILPNYATVAWHERATYLAGRKRVYTLVPVSYKCAEHRDPILVQNLERHHRDHHASDVVMQPEVTYITVKKRAG